MTNKEAIELLKKMPIVHAGYKEVIDIAIEALNCSEMPNNSDCISRQAAIETALTFLVEYCGAAFDEDMQRMLKDRLDSLPPAQPDIIRCNACKHWTQTAGNMSGFGLGDCDYLNAKFVNCNGYCYWAERQEEND